MCVILRHRRGQKCCSYGGPRVTAGQGARCAGAPRLEAAVWFPEDRAAGRAGPQLLTATLGRSLPLLVPAPCCVTPGHQTSCSCPPQTPSGRDADVGREEAGEEGLSPQVVRVGWKRCRCMGRQTDRQGAKGMWWRGWPGQGRGPQGLPTDLSPTFLAPFESGRTHPVCLGVRKWLF